MDANGRKGQLGAEGLQKSDALLKAIQKSHFQIRTRQPNRNGRKTGAGAYVDQGSVFGNIQSV